ncbi:alpha-glucosidase [Staphylococcus saccharolyticus]|uniref:Alpha-glucosidase n=1 Tax=Staphylococcus saccharolyticus TaxID=33028 RepID=A0A380HB73_9STAP|nr:alpha-glucosidase [Staphylococcus saccharolyticus]
MLQGTPYIYQGEEIGMTNPRFETIDQYRDVESLNAFKELKSKGYSEEYILKILSQKSRDNSRTPMQWSNSKEAGFTRGKSWINVTSNYKNVNVDQAIKDSNSVLHTYRRLIELRHDYDILTYGNITPLYMNHDQLFTYRRDYQSTSWLVIANFSKEVIKLPTDLNTEGDIIIQNGKITNNEISGFGSIVIETHEF